MHPIERLRYVARSSGAPQDELVRETAMALASFRSDPAGLVTACRRIVSRQLTSGAIWWLCARMLVGPDPWDEALQSVEAIENDPTDRMLSRSIPDDATVVVLGWQPQIAAGLVRRGDVEVLVVDTLGEGSAFVRHLEHRDVDAVDVPLSGLGAAVTSADVVIIEASATGPDVALCVAGARAAAAVARHAGVPVWLVAGVGRILPPRMWEALVGRLDLGDEPWDADDELVPFDLVDVVVGPGGLGSTAEVAARTDCPVAPELFKPDIT